MLQDDTRQALKLFQIRGRNLIPVTKALDSVGGNLLRQLLLLLRNLVEMELDATVSRV